MQAWLFQTGDMAGFFPEQDAGSRREPAHQMLGALKYEVPAKMAETYDRMRITDLYRSRLMPRKKLVLDHIEKPFCRMNIAITACHSVQFLRLH
ncbi:hypothetical protein [Sphingobium chlorophenolicum]|uniref:hypothetical protein n=1 Tax=Sphingobium chlorophenolicum TaxID=46429 RepID=UPI001F3F2344|nr:hypothetical protein [Sphingobium chlorophenolicum]